MSNLIYGKRIGRSAVLSPGATAIIFDDSRKKILITRRSDNKRWCLPGGAMDSGESAEEACVRETKEETGLDVKVTKLVGIYTSPGLVIEYRDGSRVQPVSVTFEADVIGGELTLSDETIDYVYASIDSLAEYDLMEHHLERILDAVLDLPGAMVK